MASVNNNLNPPVAPPLPAAHQPVISAPSSLALAKDWTVAVAKGVLYPIPKAVQWVGQQARAAYSPVESPEASIKKIKHAADRGLKIAAENGIAIKAAEIATVDGCEPHLLPPDHVDPEKWKKQIKEHTTDLSRKLSSWATLIQMRQWAKIKPVKEIDNLELMGLAERAVTKGESVWQLFKSHYKPTFIQKLRAGFFYFFFLPSLLSGIIETYLSKFIGEITQKLTTEHDDTRALVFREFLQNLNTFLVGDYKATKEFAQGVNPQTLDEIRNRNIEQRYNFNLPELCKRLSDSVMDGCPIEVPFVSSTLKSIPLIGRIFHVFELFINRYIIQKLAKSILPGILEDAATTGIELTDVKDPGSLTFAVELARFLRERLTVLDTLLTEQMSKDHPIAAEPAKQLPGTKELLENVVKHLRLVLDLEPYTDLVSLKQKLSKGSKSDWLGLDGKVDESITNGLNDACHLLFEYLNESIRSGEFFADLLKSCSKTFADEIPEPAALKKQYLAEKKEINRIAASAFNKILYSKVPQAIDESIDEVSLWRTMRGTPRPVIALTNAMFDEHRITASSLLESATVICQKMVTKTQAAPNLVATDGHIHHELGNILEIMRNLTHRAAPKKDAVKKMEIEKMVPGLNSVDQDLIWRETAPLYKQVEQMVESHVLELQSLQNKLTASAKIERHLTRLQQACDSLANNPSSEWTTPFIKSLTELPANETPDLTAKITMIKDIAVKLKEENEALDTLEKLPSYLSKLYAYENWKHPWGFKPKACLQQIDQLINQTSFTTDEKKELKALIGNGTKLLVKQSRFTDLFKTMKDRRINDQAAYKAQVTAAFVDASGAPWTQPLLQKYQLQQQSISNEMQKMSTALSQESASITAKFKSLESPLSNPLTCLQEGSTAVTVAAVPYLLIAGKALVDTAASTGTQTGAAIAATLSSVVSHVLWPSPQSKNGVVAASHRAEDHDDDEDGVQKNEQLASEQKIWNAKIQLISLAGPTAISLAAGYFIPGYAENTLAKVAMLGVNLGASWAAGHYVKRGAYSLMQDGKVGPRIHQTFEGAKGLIFKSDRFYKSFITSFMQSSANAFQHIAKANNAK